MKIEFYPSNDNLNFFKVGEGLAYCDEITELEKGVRISGWALIGRHGEYSAPQRFIFVMKGKVIGFCYVNKERPDVLKVIDKKAPLNCGFTALIPYRYIDGDPINEINLFAQSYLGLMIEILGPNGMIGASNLSFDPQMREINTSTMVNTIHGIALIISTKCNLRCSYCDINSPYYVEHEMSSDLIENIISDMKKIDVKEVHFGVMGEPTVYKDFVEISNKFYSNNYQMSIATNFSSVFNNKQIDTLLLFHTIEISIDTLDFKLLKKVRSGADVRTILYNIINLKSRAIQKNVRCPNITLSIVLNEETVLELPTLAAACSVLGINQCQLLDMRATNSYKKNPKNISKSKNQKIILNALITAIKYFNANNISLSIDASIQSFIENKNPQSNFTTTKKQKMSSKACLAPWTRIYIAPDGHVTPCYEFTSIGRITKKTPLREIINSSRIKRLRYELLSGKLNDGCKNCCRADDASPEQVRGLLESYNTKKQRAETFGQPIDTIL